MVQEYILNSVSKKNNLFMVGDVKQSIYKFRQARPELFLDKYATYELKDNIQNKSKGLKIQLFKNFRSKKQVLNITNNIFKNIMSTSLGDVDYTEEEYLNFGAEYLANAEKDAEKIELNIIDLKEEKEDIFTRGIDVEGENDDREIIENTVLEAKFVAKKIRELIDNKYQVYDKNVGYRDIKYKDICVLLRATSIMAPIYEKEIENLNLPVFSDTSSVYLETMEVQTIISLLKIIDNPMQDIPLVSVLRSNIGGFTDNELIQIRLADKNSCFYKAMLKARLVVEVDLKNKIEKILTHLETWKRQEEYLSLDELLWQIYTDTGFYHYVSLLTNGSLRQANLKLLFEKAKQFEKASLKGLFNFINFLDKVKTSSGDLGAAKLIGENENVIRIMSIHKSKGLEFPVVCLCGTGKKFNLQDLNSTVILHQDLGFGPKLIDAEKRIEYNTLAKEAIKLEIKKETISEEMRILYVALTRAKEKLIITGLDKDLKKSLKEKEQLLELYEDKEKIDSSVVGKFTSYLDWLELVYLYSKDTMQNIVELIEHNKKEILNSMDEIEDIKEDNILKEMINTKVDNNDLKKVEEILNWEYKYKESSIIPTKTSVTKLKQLKEEQFSLEQVIDVGDIIKDANTKKEIKILTSKPKFLEEKECLTPMQKGTLMHLCVQKLDEKCGYTLEKLQEFVDSLHANKIITELERKSININILYKYTQSKLWQELKNAKEIHKEKPFYINIPANTIYKEASVDDNILVQGIIDLYYINSNNELILVDYKTDYIKPGEEYKLEEKYKIQLDIYKMALENALKRKVDKAIIYPLS